MPFSDDELDGVAGGLTSAGGVVIDLDDGGSSRRTKATGSSGSSSSGDPSTIKTKSGIVIDMQD